MDSPALPVFGCIALGLVIGLIAGLVVIGASESLKKKLRSRSLAFPRAEIAALTGLLAFMTGTTWARSNWFPIADPLCGQAYFMALSVVMSVVCFASVRGLIRERAQLDAEARHP